MPQNYKTLKQLIPIDLGETSDTDLGVEGYALDRLLYSSERLLVNIFADTCYELLPDFERVLGLTPDPASSTGLRVAAVVAKIRAKGGLSKPYFINLASAMGYQIEIEEPTEFMAGWSCAGDELNHEDIVYAWWVNVLNETIPVYYFYAGSNGAGDRLCDLPESDLETLFRELKPAETQVFFIYPNYSQE